MSRAEKIAKMAITTAGQAKQDSVVSRKRKKARKNVLFEACLLYTSPSPRDGLLSRMPSSA